MKILVFGLVALVSLSAVASEMIYTSGEGSSDNFIKTNVREKVELAYKETAIDDATTEAMKKASSYCASASVEVISVSNVQCDWKFDRYDWTYGNYKCSVVAVSKCK